MATKLDKTIRREIEIDGEPFTIIVSPDGFRLTKKRFRSGVALSWKGLWAKQGRSGDSSGQDGHNGNNGHNGNGNGNGNGHGNGNGT
jgi:hypothetical protein